MISATDAKRIYLPLVLIIVTTATVWSGVRTLDLNIGDYDYIEHMAPIRTVGDVFHQFVSTDYNPPYYRPLVPVTLALDFLLFHWNGGPYHVTDLLFHLGATLIVFYFVRSIFHLKNTEALLITLFFGLMASHECDLTDDTSRTDILVAIFVMLTLIAEARSECGKKIFWRVLGLVSFAFSLLSKESGFFILPLIPLFTCSRWGSDRIKRYFTLVAPYVLVMVTWYFLHAHFSIAPSESPLRVFLPSVFLESVKQAALGLCYIVLPLDFSFSLTLFSNYGILIAIGIGIVAFGLAWFLTRPRHRMIWRSLLKPAVLFAFTTLPIIGFGRWRFYLPSIPVLIMAAIILRPMWEEGGMLRAVVLVGCLTLGVFNVVRVFEVEADWHASLGLVSSLRYGLGNILSTIPTRPIRFSYITSPIKIGNGVVFADGQATLARRAESDRLGGEHVEDGVSTNMPVSAWSAVDVTDLDRKSGFDGLHSERLDSMRFRVSVPANSSMLLMPHELLNRGASVLHSQLHDGDTITSPQCLCTIVSTVKGLAKSIDVTVFDTASLPIYFDGTNFRQF